MHDYIQLSFWIPKAFAKLRFLRIVLNIPVLVGTTQRKPDYLEMRKTCA